MPGPDVAQRYFILMASRRFAYNELGQDNPVIVDEDELRTTFFPYWLEQIEKAKQSGHATNAHTAELTWENALDDWLVVNWAWEVVDDPDLHGV